ncbi:hypothetical protein [Mixta calida]|uniref:hypothetical protein n=1 Tax=Mixta calida TaxID=665913 RepID=UPI0034D47880
MKTFLVWCPDMGAERDDACEIEAYDAESAAKKWAEEEDCNSAEYTIVSGRETPVVCVAEGEGPAQEFSVSGEAVPTYYAHPIRAGDPS